MFKTNEYYFEKITKNIDFISEHMEGISKEQLKVFCYSCKHSLEAAFDEAASVFA